MSKTFAAGPDVFQVAAVGFTKSRIVYSPVDALFLAGAVPSPATQNVSLAWSSDGVAWTSLGTTVLSAVHDLLKVESLGLWVVVGDSGGFSPGIAVSYQGGRTGWTSLPVQTSLSALGALAAVGYNSNGRFVVATTNGFAYGPDLTTWTIVTAGAYTSVGSGGTVSGLCFFNTSALLMKTSDPAAPIAISHDGGVTYSPQPLSIINREGSCTVIESQMVVSGWTSGTSVNAVARSSDLASWTAGSSAINALTSGGITSVSFHPGLSRYVLTGGVSLDNIWFASNLAASVWTPVSWNGSQLFGGNTAWSLAVATTTVAGSVGTSSSLVISGPLSIGGNLNVQAGGSLSLTSQAVVSVAGLISINGTLSVQQGGVLTSSSALVLGSASSIAVTLVQRPTNGTASVTVAVASFASLSGSFASATALAAYAGDPCVQSATPVYSSSALSVTVNLQPCSGTVSGGLSPGAVAGIVVGSVVGGVLLALAVVLLTRYALKRRSEILRQVMAMRDSNLVPLPE